MLTANCKVYLKMNNSLTMINSLFKDINGVETNADPVNGYYTLNRLLSTLRLYVGSEESSYDYDFAGGLENAGLTTLTVTNTIDGTQPSYTQNYIAIFSATYRNNTESDVTINEVGVIGNDNGSGYPSNDHFICIAREVIDPVTIAPGEAYTFTMYIG